jgi:hypothetical protein|tara:strand:- start:984 stop:1439 length:456 start_codon:yes stop_codon:yes gene_type:complete
MSKETSLRLVKLSDGTELIGNIGLTDEDSTFLRIDEPLEIMMNSRPVAAGLVEDFTSLRPWMQFANDKVFSIPKERIITICNVADDMKKYYKIILGKVKDRAKLKESLPPLTEKDIQRAADMLENLDELNANEELSDYDSELYDPKKKTIH